MSKISTRLLRIIILRLLQKRPMHGYAIINYIRKKFHVYLAPSTVYPILAELEQEGLVQHKWELNSKRMRKVYTLTSKGEDELYDLYVLISEVLA